MKEKAIKKRKLNNRSIDQLLFRLLDASQLGPLAHLNLNTTPLGYQASTSSRDKQRRATDRPAAATHHQSIDTGHPTQSKIDRPRSQISPSQPKTKPYVQAQARIYIWAPRSPKPHPPTPSRQPPALLSTWQPARRISRSMAASSPLFAALAPNVLARFGLFVPPRPHLSFFSSGAPLSQPIPANRPGPILPNARRVVAF